MGLPLGLGKPNAFVNALYARVRELPERRLTSIFFGGGTPSLMDPATVEAVIGAATPLDARRSATVPLGAITASHRLQYPVARSITKRFSRGESPGT